MIKKVFLFHLLFLLVYNFTFSQTTASIQNISNSLIISNANNYKLKYNVNCVQDKITDNKGNGFEGLYGTRNLRVVLHGVAYRGGGNNYYHRTNKRNNKHFNYSGCQEIKKGIKRFLYLAEHRLLIVVGLVYVGIKIPIQ